MVYLGAALFRCHGDSFCTFALCPQDSTYFHSSPACVVSCMRYWEMPVISSCCTRSKSSADYFLRPDIKVAPCSFISSLYNQHFGCMDRRTVDTNYLPSSRLSARSSLGDSTAARCHLSAQRATEGLLPGLAAQCVTRSARLSRSGQSSHTTPQGVDIGVDD